MTDDSPCLEEGRICHQSFINCHLSFQEKDAIGTPLLTLRELHFEFVALEFAAVELFDDG